MNDKMTDTPCYKCAEILSDENEMCNACGAPAWQCFKDKRIKHLQQMTDYQRVKLLSLEAELESLKVQAMAMTAENDQRESAGRPQACSGTAFMEVAKRLTKLAIALQKMAIELV